MKDLTAGSTNDSEAALGQLRRLQEHLAMDDDATKNIESLDLQKAGFKAHQEN